MVNEYRPPFDYAKLSFLSDLDYARTLMDVDRRLIGARIGLGLEHRVYEYGDKDVLKIPRRRLVYKPPTADIKQWEADIIGQYFPQYYLPTQVRRSSDHPYYGLVQERLSDFSPLSSDNIGLVADQFGDLVAVNRHLFVEQGLCLDFIGWEGFRRSLQAYASNKAKPVISNIVVVGRDKPRLTILDQTIFCLRENNYGPTLDEQTLRQIIYLSFGVNRQVVRDFFGIDIVG